MKESLLAFTLYILSFPSVATEFKSEQDLKDRSYSVLKNVTLIAEEFKTIEDVDKSPKYMRLYENEMSIIDSYLVFFYAQALFDISKKESQEKFYFGKIARRSSYLCNRSVNDLEMEIGKYHQKLNDLLDRQIIESKNLCDEIQKIGDKF